MMGLAMGSEDPTLKLGSACSSSHPLHTVSDTRSRIFDFLSVHELGTAAAVCHQWKTTCGANLRQRTKITSQDLELLGLRLDQVLHTFPAIETLNLASASFQLFQNIQDPESVVRMCRQLKAIWLSPIVPKTMLRTMFRNLQALETLNARLIPTVNDQTIKDLVAPSLKRVDLSGCYSLTDHGLRQLFSMSPHIQVILLKGCESITFQPFEALRPEALRIASLDGSRNTFLMSDVTRLTEICPSLHKLELAHFRHIQSASEQLERMSAKLTTLKIIGNSSLPPQTISAFKENGCTLAFDVRAPHRIQAFENLKSKTTERNFNA
eukprot:gb/GECG01011799.1/.p1 GENE.gb/GECG01011799.1/~~gb/GECG01011799.1/.p1  ORF type:complete len:323 (+),score=20.62 gb/GECG01011799.1/:1-969(+)